MKIQLYSAVAHENEPTRAKAFWTKLSFNVESCKCKTFFMFFPNQYLDGQKKYNLKAAVSQIFEVIFSISAKLADLWYYF